MARVKELVAAGVNVACGTTRSWTRGTRWDGLDARRALDARARGPDDRPLGALSRLRDGDHEPCPCRRGPVGCQRGVAREPGRASIAPTRRRPSGCALGALGLASRKGGGRDAASEQHREPRTTARASRCRTSNRKEEGMATEVLTREGMPSREGDLTIEASRHGAHPRRLRAMDRWAACSRSGSRPNLVPAAFAIGTLAAADFLQVGFIDRPARPSSWAIVVGSILVGLLGAAWARRPAWPRCPPPACRTARPSSLPGLLNWLSCIGWDGINSIFGATRGHDPRSRPCRSGWHSSSSSSRQGAAGVVGYEGIHTFEKYGAIVLGDLVRHPDRRHRAQVGHRHRPRRWLRGPRPARRLRALQLDHRQLRASPGRSTPPTTAATCRPTASRSQHLLVDRSRPDAFGRLDRAPRSAGRRSGAQAAPCRPSTT